MRFLFIILFSFSAMADNGVTGSENRTLGMSHGSSVQDGVFEIDEVLKGNQAPSYSIMDYDPTQEKELSLGPYDLVSLRALYLSAPTYPTVKSIQNLIALLEETCDIYHPNCDFKIILEVACLVQDGRGNLIQRCSDVEIFELRRDVSKTHRHRTHNFLAPQTDEVFDVNEAFTGNQAASYSSVMDYSPIPPTRLDLGEPVTTE